MANGRGKARPRFKAELLYIKRHGFKIQEVSNGYVATDNAGHSISGTSLKEVITLTVDHCTAQTLLAL